MFTWRWSHALSVTVLLRQKSASKIGKGTNLALVLAVVEVGERRGVVEGPAGELVRLAVTPVQVCIGRRGVGLSPEVAGGEGVEAVEGDGEGALLPVPRHPVAPLALVVRRQRVAADTLLACTGVSSHS